MNVELLKVAIFEHRKAIEALRNDSNIEVGHIW